MAVDLETRARSAGAAMRRAVEPVVASPRVPASPPPRRLVPALVFAVVAVGLTAAAVAFVRQTDRDKVATGPRPVPRLIPGQLPEGFTATGAADLPEQEPSFDEIPLLLTYGPDGDSTELMVILSGHPMEGDGGEDEYPVTLADGRPAVIRTHETFGPAIVWSGDALHATAGGYTMTADQLIAFASAATVGPGATFTPGPMPEGFVESGRIANPHYATIAPVPIPPGKGAVVAYHQNESGFISVATVEATLSEQTAMGFFFGPDRQAVTVRGREGLVFIQAFDVGPSPVQTLMWNESPGIVVMLTTYGLETAQTMAVAESLRPATDDEWDALVALSSDDDVAVEPLSTVMAGSGIDGELNGTPWHVYLDEQGALCFEAADHGSCTSPDPDLVYTETTADDTVSVWGLVPEGTASVRANAGGAAGYPLQTDGVIFAGTVSSFGDAVTVVLFYDSDGNEISRRRVP